MEFMVNTLTLTVRFAVTLMIASMGEMFNQKAGIFNLGCEGIMSVGAFLGMLIPFSMVGAGTAPGYVNVLGLVVATISGALLGLLFGVFVITFRAPQGIAGIGMQMFGVGLAGTFFRSFIGGTQSITGISSMEIPLLSKIPVIGKILFSHNPLVYFAYLLVPVAWYVIFKTPWGLKVRAVGTHPRAADSLGINVTRIRYESLAVGGAMAGFAGAFLTLCQAIMRVTAKRTVSVSVFTMNSISGLLFCSTRLSEESLAETFHRVRVRNDHLDRNDNQDYQTLQCLDQIGGYACKYLKVYLAVEQDSEEERCRNNPERVQRAEEGYYNT